MKPILFNTEMIRAILDDRKTVTRRAVKPQPTDTDDCQHEMQTYDQMLPQFYKGDYSCVCRKCGYGTQPDGESVFQPPYHPSDILYVREMWRIQSARRFEADTRIEFKAGGDMVRIQFPGRRDQYHSRREYDTFVSKWGDDRWHPSIHMPREAARIFLRVTDVRVERLQHLGIEEALKEGITPTNRPGGCRCRFAFDGCMEEPCSNRTAYEIERHVEPFAQLWDSTIKPADRALYGWAANPWVWVIEFERCEKPKGE